MLPRPRPRRSSNLKHRARRSANRIPRRDSEAKVRGITRYAADLPVPGLLHARLVLAHEAHARIVSIETDEARRAPGVAGVLTAADLPIVATGPGRGNQPLAREEVVYAGQPIAIVVADSEAAAADAADLVWAELESLTPVLDLETAIRPGAPRARISVADQGDGSDIADAHAAVSAGAAGEEEQLSDNVLGSARLSRRRRSDRAGGQPRRGERTLPHPVDLPGVPRDPDRHGLARPGGRAGHQRIDSGAVRHPRRPGRAVRLGRRPHTRSRRAARAADSAGS